MTPLPKSGGRNNRGRDDRASSRRRSQAALPGRSTSGATRPACRPPCTPSSTIPNRSARIALLHYADGEKRYILAPVGLASATASRPGRRPTSSRATACRSPTSRSAPPCTPSSCGPGAARSSAAAPGASIQLMAKEGDYALLKLPSGELRRVRLACRATIGQVGNLEHENLSHGKAGRRALARAAAARARHRHEPGRPSARRRRGALQGQPSADPVGQADQGLQDAAQQAHGQVHPPAPQGPSDGPEETTAWHARSKRVPSWISHLREEGAGDDRVRRQAGRQDLVAPLDDHARHGRHHVRRAQRPEVHPGVRHRERGRPQARRVLADAHVPRPLRRPQGQGRGRLAAPRPGERGSSHGSARVQQVHRASPRRRRVSSST